MPKNEGDGSHTRVMQTKATFAHHHFRTPGSQSRASACHQRQSSDFRVCGRSCQSGRTAYGACKRRGALWTQILSFGEKLCCGHSTALYYLKGCRIPLSLLTSPTSGRDLFRPHSHPVGAVLMDTEATVITAPSSSLSVLFIGKKQTLTSLSQRTCPLKCTTHAPSKATASVRRRLAVRRWALSCSG